MAGRARRRRTRRGRGTTAEPKPCPAPPRRAARRPSGWRHVTIRTGAAPTPPRFSGLRPSIGGAHIDEVQIQIRVEREDTNQTETSAHHPVREHLDDPRDLPRRPCVRQMPLPSEDDLRIEVRRNPSESVEANTKMLRASGTAEEKGSEHRRLRSDRCPHLSLIHI